MLACILAKALASVLAWCVVTLAPSKVWLQAFLIGIAPIWLEVAASFVTRTEPGRETRVLWRRFDAVVDALSFVISPALWFYLVLRADPASRGHVEIVTLALLVFACAGLYRLMRFSRRGLSGEGHFEGLPVTYTGYVWIVGLFLTRQPGWDWLFALALAILSIAMLSTKIKVRPSR